MKPLFYKFTTESPAASYIPFPRFLMDDCFTGLGIVVRIKLKLKAYDRCQSIDPTTEIRKSHRQIHLFKSGSICIIQHG